MIALAVIALLIAQPAMAEPAGPSGPVMQLQRWLWPNAKPEVPLPQARPPEAPQVAKPAPHVVAPKPAAKPKPKEAPTVKAKPARAEMPRISAAQCAQIGMGIAMIGREGVKREARARGYSDAQINGAARACGY